MKVLEVVQTCKARPSQWEGRLEDGRALYVRYRYGYLQIGAGSTLGEAIDDTSIFGKQLATQLDGELSYQDLLDITSGLLTWPT